MATTKGNPDVPEVFMAWGFRDESRLCRKAHRATGNITSPKPPILSMVRDPKPPQTLLWDGGVTKHWV